MRRVFASLTGLVLLASVLGCNHTAGVCDCGAYTPCAGGCCIGGDHVAPAPLPAPAGQIISAEPLKAMPKGSDKE
jgi:hypothetical protein